MLNFSFGWSSSVKFKNWKGNVFNTRGSVQNVKGQCLFSLFRLHTTKNISPSPTLQIGGVRYIDVDQGSLIYEKSEK